ncbi:YtxH domain-containing protein [Streptomyces sp. TRM43335]|uniref:YtxH domain-containing protein n=1 Tax=Streptomyces taklimakanensis TaxID=2569853 RepID=A0A6G2B9J4_9ACTN|nr:YtxH domain-containing protein [Streptomyces taklimakanensis]MTE18930.1 YtxH domain-containing protein [Streptomyces taklimakanensis]
MRYRLTFVAGVAVGYVFGTRAGREKYEELRAKARRLAENPAVRNACESATQNGREMAGKALGAVSERMGDRMPGTVSDRVRTLRVRRVEQRTPFDDGWGTGNN